MSTSQARTTLFCLHALGLSGAEFGGLSERLAGEIAVVAFDLPGFGAGTAASGTSVEEMVEFVIRKIRAHGSTRFLLLGHSMGGKIATIVASRTLAGTAPIFGLAGVVLLAASPPSPEPMPEDKREQMIGWAVDGPLSAASAREFIDSNVGEPLPAADDALAVADVQRASPEAWRAWFQRGSREDWSGKVGELRMPALIISGGADGDLGASAQHELNGAVYSDARFVTLEGAGHLLPLERPADLAELIRAFARDATGPAIAPDVARVIASPRTSSRTRGILARRALVDDPSTVPRALDPAQLATLRAVAQRVVPQGRPAIDLALRLDAQLADGQGDGWRHATLPADIDAYRLALDALDGFDALSDSDQDAQLAGIADGSAEVSGRLTAEQLTAWFEDARADLVRVWLAHPSSLAHIGFDGFANGGDGERKQGFELLAAGEREAWEPALPTTDRGHA